MISALAIRPLEFPGIHSFDQIKEGIFSKTNTYIHLIYKTSFGLNDAPDVLGEVIRIASGYLVAVGAELLFHIEIDAIGIDLHVQMTNEAFDEALTERFVVLLAYAVPGLLFDPVGE